MNNRKNFAVLPTIAELKKIIAQETKRPLPREKESIHYADFSSTKNLLNAFELSTDYFNQELTFEDLEKHQLFSEVNILGIKLLANILKNPDNTKIYNQVYDYLTEVDKPKKSDLIFVFGAKTLSRVEKAIELYQNDIASKILFSGGNPFYDQNKKAEAEIYKEFAMQAGVLEQDIITETKSITIPDNIRTSLNQLDTMGMKFKSITLVNSPYAQRRGWAVFKKYTSDSTTIYRVNCATAEKFSRDNWYKNEEGIKVIFNELVKLKLAVILNTA